MTLLGNTALRGAFTTGGLTIGNEALAGSLDLAAGTTVSGTTGTLLYGPVHASGAGTRLRLTGALTLGGARTGLSFAANTLTVDTGAAVQAGVLTLANPGNGSNDIVVDGTSSLEVGVAGGVAAGTLKVDRDRVLSGAGAIVAPRGIVDEGIIRASEGLLTLRSEVTGDGVLEIGTGATLFVGGTAGATTTRVVFAGPGSTLTVAPRYSAEGPALTQEGRIDGFQEGTTIAFFGASPVTAATYSADAAGPGLGLLRLQSGATPLGSLTLSGSYAGYVFQVAPGGADTYAVTLTLAAGEGTGGGGLPSAGTLTADAYAWSAGGSGTWGMARNWTNVSTGATPAGIAPGSRNPVTVAGPTSIYQTISGPGNSSSLSFVGNTVLTGASNTGAFNTGAFNTGALSVGTAAMAGALNLSAGARLAAAAASVLSGTVQVSGGSTLTAAGGLTVGGARSGLLFSANGLTVDTGGTLLTAGLVLASPGNGSNAISIDPTGRLEVGLSGVSGAGTLTVGSGRTLWGEGRIAAAGGIVNQGTIVAEGGTLALLSPVIGGALGIGAGATLFVDGTAGPSTASVSFGGAGGTLEVAPLAIGTGLTQQGVISGFGVGRTIAFHGASEVTSARFIAGGAGLGTLTLFSGAAPLGSLTLAGNFTGRSFQVGAAGGNVSNVAVGSADLLFDDVYYLAHNPDVTAAGIDPYQHYLANGYREGRNPSALFSTSYYLSRNPDVAAAGVNPLLHFEVSGWREGRDPSAGFSLSDYLVANADVKAAGLNPLLHYVSSGKAEGRAAFAVYAGPADAGVDAAYYYAAYPDVRAAGVNATAHYHGSGWREGRNPDAFFDTRYYLTQNPDVRAAGVDALAHFEANGWREGREPSLVFSDARYLAAYPDVRAAGVDPLLHYLGSGRGEGRMAFLTGGAAAADPLVDATYYDRQLGATLIPGGAAAAQQAAWSYDGGGWQRGLNPDAFFDTAYYLSRNPDVAAAGINPLLHYEVNGWREGRDASASFSTGKYLAAYGDVRAAGLNPLLHYVVNGQGEGRSAFSA